MVNLGTLKIKIFGRSKKQIIKDMHFLCRDMSDILEDMLEDLDDIQKSVQESNRLILKVQDNCDEIIKTYERMQKRDENENLALSDSKIDTTEDVIERIDKIIAQLDKENITR